MKAAVLHQAGIPAFEEFPDPVVQHEHEVILEMKAASVKNLDKMRAGGKHYASYTHYPVIAGIDGVGILPDGKRVYAQGKTGTMAEKAIADLRSCVVLPDELSDTLAAALPNAVAGAAMALKFRAGMQPGDVVLVNGATGVTGQLAVQAAAIYGASRIIVTGRNPQSLQKLLTLGAHDIVSLNNDDATIVSQLKELHHTYTINTVIDYLWGRPMELILTALKGGGLHNYTQKVRIVTVGEMAGPTITLPSGILRSTAFEILGSGIGSLSKDEMAHFNTDMLPEMFRLAAVGKLQLHTVTVPLSHVAQAWEHEYGAGSRLVFSI